MSPFLLGGFFVLTVLLAGLIVHAEAAVTYFYVSPQGSDSNPGTKEAPWKTLQHAAEAAKPGDTVRVMKGTYEPFTINNKGQHFDEGSAQNQTFLTLQPAPGVQPYEVIVDGGGRPACVTVNNSDSVIVSGMTLQGCPKGVVNVSGTNVTVRNVKTENVTDCRIYVTPSEVMGCDGQPGTSAPEPQAEETATPPAVEETASAWKIAPQVAAQSNTPRRKGGLAPFPMSQPNLPGPSSKKECAALAITASNYQEGNLSAYARDNNLNTRWSMDGLGAWIQFDLGSVMPIDQVGIAWLVGDQRTAKFAVDVSADGSTWYRVFEGSSSGKTKDIETYDFQAPDSRYVRLVNEGNSQRHVNDWMSITEVAFDKALGNASNACGVSQGVASSPGKIFGPSGISLARPPLSSRAACTGNAIFSEDYENGLGQWENHGGCYDYSFATVPDPAGTPGNHVLQVTNRMGDDNRNCAGWPGSKQNDQFGSYYKHRAEMMPVSKAFKPRYGENVSMSERILFDSAYPQTPPNPYGITLWQVISEPWRGVDLQLSAVKEGLVFRVRQGGANSSALKEFPIGPIPREQWIDIEFRFKRSIGSDGYAQVYINGKQVVNYTGPTTQSTSENTMMKHGLYLGVPPTTNKNGEFKVYFDDVRRCSQ